MEMITENIMFGVVLWSDQQQNRAVIWCDDHGDLAFYNGECDGGEWEEPLDPGDLVQFELHEDGTMRMARNPRLVVPDEYPTLTDDLKTAGVANLNVSIPAAPSVETGQAKIIAFEPKSETSKRRNRLSRQVM